MQRTSTTSVWLVFSMLSSLIALGVDVQGPETTSTPRPAAEEHIRRLIQSLPADSTWRGLLERGVTGDGAHQPWMDDMRRAAVKLAVVSFDFKWAQHGRRINNWTLYGIEYFRDYDRSDQIIDPEQLAEINATNLGRELADVALLRAKSAYWFERPRQRNGLGYKDIWLADDPWLPLPQPMNLLGAYRRGVTPLMRAALHGDVVKINELVRGDANVNAVAPDGLTALMYAALGGNAAAVQALLAAGANPNATDHAGSTPLMWADSGDSPAAVQALLRAGAEVNTNARGRNVLVGAVASGHASIVRILLQAGADPNSKDKNGRSVLWIATRWHYTEVAQLLRQAGARM